MSPTVDLSRAAQIVVQGHNAAPCAVVAAAVRIGNAFVYGAGVAGSLSYDEGAPAATIDTPFDLASVTKPITALAMARLVRRKLLSRDETIADVLPELSSTGSARISLDLLAAHRGGLDAHGSLYAPLVRGETSIDPLEAIVCAANMRHVSVDSDPPPEGFVPVYSDLGYLLLGVALARRAGRDLDDVMSEDVLDPVGVRIGSARRLRAGDPSFDDRVAPTEVVPFRGGVVRGVVHDENAWALGRDGVCGHAGLFGRALDVARLGAAVLDALKGRSAAWLGPDDIEPLVRVRHGGSLLAGFDARSGISPGSGARLGARSFGHLGFTGTSLWIDPDAEFVGVLLSNRVHPTRTSLAIRSARPAAYDAMFDAMTAASDRG